MKEMRYDANTTEHGHFQCQECKAITDLLSGAARQIYLVFK